MVKKKLNEIKNKFGRDKLKNYLLWFYNQEENVAEFVKIYTDHLTDKTPEFHKKILRFCLRPGWKAIASPRGFAKSTLVCLFLTSWCALTGRKHFILIISDTLTQAKLHLGALKAELENNRMINWLYGDVVGVTWGEERIIVNTPNGEVMIMALGAGTKIRGLKFKQYRPELVVIDDLENSEMVYSPERRQKLQRWFDYDLKSGVDKDGDIIYLGTILHYDALLKKVVERKGQYQSWQTIMFKALDENGESIWPDRYPTETLKAMRDDPAHPKYVGSLVFSQEYQNEPQDDKDRIIRPEWLKHYQLLRRVMEMPGENDEEKRQGFIKSFSEIVAAVDPAIGDKEQSDFFSMYVMGVEKVTNNEYQLDLLRGKFTIDEQVEKIVEMCKTWQVKVLGIESNAYQAGLFQLVRSAMHKAGLSTRIIKIRTDKDKVRRAKIHSVAFEGGFIYLRQDHRDFDIIKAEITEFPLAAHDDSFDSLMLARETKNRPNKARAFANKPLGL
jgi:predicted phage terminase large subunit-like protein